MTGDFKGLATVKKTLADGSVRSYCYAWRGGPMLKSPTGEPLSPDDPALSAAFHATHDQRRSPQTDDMAMLIREFKQSSDFQIKSADTRREYNRYLDAIRAAFGALSFVKLENIKTRGRLKAWRDTMIDHPRTADYAWTTLARVLSFAKDRGHISVNIAEKGGRLYKVDRRESIWSQEDIHQFSAAAPAYLQLALLMALWTGQRQGDLLRATWSAYDGKTLRLRQSKTDARVIIPVGKTLGTALNSELRLRDTILTNSRGDPWTLDGPNVMAQNVRPRGSRRPDIP